MKTAYINAMILDGTPDMSIQKDKILIVEDGIIKSIIDKKDSYSLENCKITDLHGSYLLPGLINLHVHLAGNGQTSAKQRDNEAMVKKIMSNALTRSIAYHLVCKFAKLELLGGVTTIRTVGGLGDFDTRCRDDSAKGKILAPRILAANQGISVPGGHMAGSVAIIAKDIPQAVEQVHKAKEQKVDLIKLMVTGGVMDAREKGTPGELKMSAQMIKAVCDEAHKMGFKVAAHTESSEGVRTALENGVDSIEHGALMDSETIDLYKKNNAFVCTTLSPVIPYMLLPLSVTKASEKDQYNSRIVFEGIVDSAIKALENDIPVGLGNDVGCPYVTQYDFWRELCYFKKYCNVSSEFSLYTATLRNAQLIGIDNITGSIQEGKSADFIVTKCNPLEDLRALRSLQLVVCRGRQIKNPKPLRKKAVDRLLDPYLAQ